MSLATSPTMSSAPSSPPSSTRSRAAAVLAAVLPSMVLATSCFPLERTASLTPGSVLGSATRPDVDGSPGAGFVKITGVGSNVVRTGDADGAFVVAGLSAGRLDLRFVDDVDGDGWADRGRDISVFIAADGGDGGLGTVDVGPLPLGGTFGLRGTSTPPDAIDDSQVVRIYALRGRCAVDVGDGSDSDRSAGACDDDSENVLPRLEHGVDAEVAADDTGAWLMTRLVAGPVDVVAVLHERNADGSLGAVVDVVGPFPVDGSPTDLNDPPRDAGVVFDFDDVPPPAVRVQLVLSRAIEDADAFAVLTPPGAVVPACTSDTARATAEAIAGAVVVDAAVNSFSATVPAGAWNVVVCDGARRGAASSLVSVASADEVPALWPIVMLDGDRCPLDPTDPADTERDCDADGRRGLPLSTIDALRASCATQCFPDEATPFSSLGAAIGDRTCEVDGDRFDCDDDADGQPDVTEPTACIGAGRGTDLDGDGLCSVVDSFPHCAANTAAACPVGVEDITPRVQGGGASGIALVRAPVGTTVTVSSGGDSVDVAVVEGADEDGVTLLYGEVAFTPPSSDPTALEIAAGGVDGVVCGLVSTSPIVIGCEHGHELVSRDGDVASFFGEGSEVAVGGLPEDDSEGRYIAFQSLSSLLPGGADGEYQIYWLDRGTGVTLLVSAAAGVAGDGRSDQVGISADGFSVIFTSLSTNLVADDTNGTSDVFVWRVTEPDRVERVSVDDDDGEGVGASAAGSIDADGDTIAFTSSSPLTAGLSGSNTVNVFRKNLVDGEVTLMTRRLEDGAGIGGLKPSISHDGDRVAFWASFTGLVDDPADDSLWDVYVHQASTGDTKRISAREQGGDGPSSVAGVAISGDGRFVAWTSSSDTVVPEDGNGRFRDVFVTDVDNETVVLASVDSESNSPVGQDEQIALSRDGRFVVFSSASTTTGVVVLRDLVAGASQTIVTTGSVGVPAISAKGAYVVVGAATALDPRSSSTGTFAVFTGQGPSWWAGR